MELLLDEGIEALTMRRLADALDLTPGAMYRYFPGKDAILSTLGKRALERIAVVMDAEEARVRGLYGEALRPEEILHLVLARSLSYWSFCVEEPATWRLVNLLLVDPRKFIIEEGEHENFIQSVVLQLSKVGGLLDEALQLKALEEGSTGLERALTMFTTLNGSLLLLKLGDNHAGLAPEATLHLAMSTLLLGWGASKQALDRAWQLHTRSSA